MSTGDELSESLTDTPATVEPPLTKVSSRPARSLDKRREGAFCVCGMQLSLTGACANCD